MKYDFQQYNALLQRPLRLPRVISSSARTIGVFLSYLQQGVTQQAILATAQTPAQTKQLRDALHQLTVLVGVPRDHESLCRLVAYAPALQLVSTQAWRVRDPVILPEAALLPGDLTEACVAAYHAWVAQRSRARWR